MKVSSGNSCIDRVKLLLLEDGLLAAADAAATREHLAACPRCRALARESDDLSATVARCGDSRAGGDCPAPHVIATYAEGLMAHGDRGVLEEHLGNCGRCTAALAALGRELAGLELDPEVETPAWALERARAMVEGEAAAPKRAATTGAARRAAVRPGGFSRFIESLRPAAFPVAALAAIAIMVVVQIPEPRISGSPIRGANPMEEAAIRIMAPEEGVVVEPTGAVLAWEPVPGAGTYKVTVVDASGAVVWTATAADSWIRIPARRVLMPGAVYAFWVSGVLDSGESVESAVRHFTAGRSSLR
jgi:hypothetical protein